VAKEGELSGVGAIKYADGSAYAGQFADSKENGFGVKLYPDGRYTLGHFVNGKRHGRCTTFYQLTNDKVHFDGQYNQDEYASSTGSIRYDDGRVFTGNCSSMRGSTGRPDRTVVLTAFERATLTRIAANAKEFAHNTWPVADGRSTVRVLDASDVSRRSVRRFVRGVRLLRSLHSLTRVYSAAVTRGAACADDDYHASSFNPHDGMFGWHGTSKDAIPEICASGFDTARRSGQVHGPGEYFSQHYQVSMGYCEANCSQMVLAYVFKGPFTCHSDGFCVVCNNPPSHSGVSFCLPVAIVTFDRANVKPFAAPAGSVLRWQFLWEDDSGVWVPYADEPNALLCEAWNRFAAKGPRPYTVTLRTTRLNDLRPDSYTVDVEARTQVNDRTKFKRNIQVVAVPAIPAV
jgi:hypothetical protein